MKTVVSIGCHCKLVVPAKTYTVKIPLPVEPIIFTNVIAWPTNCNPAGTCRLVRYVEKGQTNEFHAFRVPIQIRTNSGSSRGE